MNGGVSFWWSRLGLPEPRPRLPGNREVDVCVVGGGYTGLWTAYHLKKAEPGLRIAVLEQRFCGYGASGRNGGWLYNGFAGRAAFARRYGREPAAAMQRVMDAAVGEVTDTLDAEGIDADVVRGGVLEVARTPAQLARLRAFAAAERTYGADRVQELGAAETAERLRVAGALGGVWSPHGARVQPAKLAAGLADAVERMGVDLHESTPVTAIRGGRTPRAVTPYGTVTARYVLRATEGFTAGLAGEHRTWLPMNSAMIATEPLPPSFWAGAGWEGREVLGDFAHAYMYAQRTADDRIALGGRGVPYRFGSRTDVDGATQPATVRQLREILHAFFPAARTARIEHAWAGVLGVPRDWCATVDLDPRTGLGWAGGYVGSGVTTANLAGRTLCDLVLGHDTELTRLPWVGHTVRRWEPEPLRWLGVHALYAAYHAADRREAASRRPGTSPLARLADTIAGR
ncbi:NAD(P)/FAD-dependent oxidoreductase [Kitasatospora sp. NPDC057692]|uniref:NAD(P)/FAD-dependent oxidoreductase n=1 Tax=Kitasatospora sp. NPDC057692 TaxID=3346215 RepID=UPI0036B05CE3